MYVDKFKRMCEKQRLNPCEKVTVDGIDIYIADGYVNVDIRDEVYEPSWKTIWLVGVGGKADIGQSLYFKFGSCTKDERIKKAIEEATVFAKESKKNGRYIN